MSTAIARSTTPLVVVRGVAASFPITMTNPQPPAGNGAPRDLTGSTITAVLMGIVSRALAVARTNDVGGAFAVALSAVQTADLPPSGADPRIIVTVTDPQGGVVIAVYPLTSTIP